MNLSPLIRGIKNDSILSISVINKVFPNLIANSILVKIFSSCNETVSNWEVFCVTVFLNQSVALLTGSMIKTVLIELFIKIAFSIDKVSVGNPSNFNFNISLSFKEKCINDFTFFLFSLNLSEFIAFIQSLNNFSLTDSL